MRFCLFVCFGLFVCAYWKYCHFISYSEVNFIHFTMYLHNTPGLKINPPHTSEPVWSSGKALGWEVEGPRFDSASALPSLQKGCHLWTPSRDFVPHTLRLSFLFKKVVICGHRLVTLSLTINETLKWLSSLPILMQESFWWRQCSDRYIISLSPHLHTPFPSFSPSLMVSVDVKHHDNLLITYHTTQRAFCRQFVGLPDHVKCSTHLRLNTVKPYFDAQWMLTLVMAAILSYENLVST